MDAQGVYKVQQDGVVFSIFWQCAAVFEAGCPGGEESDTSTAVQRLLFATEIYVRKYSVLAGYFFCMQCNPFLSLHLQV